MAEAWKARLRERVVEADALCRGSRDKLAAVALPAHPAAIGALRDVSGDLFKAVYSMRGAELLALHGGNRGGGPAQQLASVEDLAAPEDDAQRAALGNLWNAKFHAGEANEEVQQCCGHLQTASLLLRHSGLPGMVDLTVAELKLATVHLRTASDQAQKSVEAAGKALQDLPAAD